LFLGTGISSALQAADPAPKGSAAGAADGPVTIAPRTARSFYGWQILATGEAGGALAAASLALPDQPLNGFLPTAGFLLGMPFYALGGPVAHWSHGDFSKGLVSLGGNVVFPVAAGLIGRAAACGDVPREDCRSRGFVDGVALGLLLAPIVDAAILGWEDVPIDVVGKRDKNKDEPRMLGLLPSIRFPRGGLILGLSGRF
jgi:hypothetical protein